MRTWEDIIRFDSGLTVGTHCVTLKVDGAECRALVEITSRGRVWVFVQPAAGALCWGWRQLAGNAFTEDFRSVPAQPAHDPELMSLFDNPTSVIAKP